MDAGRRNLAVIFFSNVVASMGMQAFLPAFPIILPKLGVTDPRAVSVWAGVLTASAPFSAALAGPLWGALGDRIGRKVMVLRSLIGIVFFVGAMAFVTNPWLLLMLRLGQGMFSGFIAPSLTLVSVHSPPDRQGLVAAQLQVALLLGAVIGPPVGGQILDHGSASSVFLLASGAAAVSAALVAAFASETVRPVPHGGGEGAWEAARHAVRDVRATLADPVVRGLLAAVFAVRFGSSCVEPLFAHVVQQYESTSAFVRDNFGLANGTIFTAMNVGNLLALPFWGRRGDLHGHRRSFLIAAVCAGVFYAPQAFAPNPESLLIIRLVVGAFLAGVIPAAYGIMAQQTTIERRGSGYSLTFSAVALANSFAPVAGGVAVHYVGIRNLILIAAVPIVLAGAVGMRGRER